MWSGGQAYTAITVGGTTIPVPAAGSGSAGNQFAHKTQGIVGGDAGSLFAHKTQTDDSAAAGVVR